MKVLILAPHTDDGELGGGATLAKLIDEGNEIYYVAFSICEESVPEGFPKNILEIEVKRATRKIGIKDTNLIIKKYKVRKFPQYRQEILEDLMALDKKYDFDLVFSPSSFDIHQDHSTIYKEAIRAFKNKSILGYEFMWNNFSFSSTCFYIVNENQIQRKIDAIAEYKSQAHKFNCQEKLVKGLANFRGLQISAEYAEAFEVIRWIVR